MNRLTCVFFFFYKWWWPSLSAQEERGEEANPDPHVSWFFLRWRVNPRVVSIPPCPKIFTWLCQPLQLIPNLQKVDSWPQIIFWQYCYNVVEFETCFIVFCIIFGLVGHYLIGTGMCFWFDNLYWIVCLPFEVWSLIKI
jgi:hypothetical protein